MRFYTNVQMVGNNFLVRGYENGEKVKKKKTELGAYGYQRWYNDSP